MWTKQGVLFESMNMPSLENIREALDRAPRGTSKDIAKAIGASRQQLSMWKNGAVALSYARGLQIVSELRQRGLLE